MVRLTSELKRARAELEHAERQLAKIAARTAGKRTEVARLEEAVAREQGGGRDEGRRERATGPDDSQVVPLPSARTDAIVAVLRRDGVSMSPSELVQALARGGRREELRSVTATLSHLLRSGRVVRPEPGRYRST